MHCIRSAQLPKETNLLLRWYSEHSVHVLADQSDAKPSQLLKSRLDRYDHQFSDQKWTNDHDNGPQKFARRVLRIVGMSPSRRTNRWWAKMIKWSANSLRPHPECASLHLESFHLTLNSFAFSLPSYPVHHTNKMRMKIDDISNQFRHLPNGSDLLRFNWSHKKVWYMVNVPRWMIDIECRFFQVSTAIYRREMMPRHFATDQNDSHSKSISCLCWRIISLRYLWIRYLLYRWTDERK